MPGRRGGLRGFKVVRKDTVNPLTSVFELPCPIPFSAANSVLILEERFESWILSENLLAQPVLLGSIAL